MAKKKVKVIKIDADKCSGCRACEAACAAIHAEPRYSSVNPAKSRIYVYWDPIRNLFVPVYGGPYVEAECLGRDKYVINEKEYDECMFCRATACPSRDIFKDPDSGLPLRCDMCEVDPTLEEPMCVQVCYIDALVYEEREEEVEEEVKVEDLEIGLDFLINKYGMDKVAETLSRIAASKREE